MDDKYNVKELHEDLYQVFMKQDYENEYFDVTFFVDGKELYAHGQTLAAASPVFKEQLLKNRLNPNKPIIQINDDFTYDEFFEFIRLIYYDFFQVAHFDYYANNMETRENIFVIHDLSNIYKAKRIKKFCDEYYMDLNINDIEHIFECIKLKRKYSWEPERDEISETISYYFLSLIEFDGFINLDKTTVEAFAYYVTHDETYAYKNEKLYETIYKWGEYQAMITEEMPDEEKKEAVLHQIKDILPWIELEFEELTNKFLFDFAVPKGLISYDEADKYKMKYVRIYNEVCNFDRNPQKICGSFIDCYGIYDAYLEYRERNSDSFSCSVYLETHGQHKCYLRNKNFQIPSTPSTVEKMKGCEWYLLLEENGKLAMKHRSKIERSDYLIAEMKSKDEFSLTEKNNVRIFVSYKPF